MNDYNPQKQIDQAAKVKTKRATYQSQGRQTWRITPEIQANYYALVAQGFTKADAARKVGVSPGAMYHKDKLRGTDKAAYRNKAISVVSGIPPPLHRSELSDWAKRGQDDLSYFAQRYFGYILMPFHQKIIETITVLLDSPQEEYVVVNMPPGSGKSTICTSLALTWMICRDRAIRTLIGSSSQRNASTYSDRVRNSLTRTTPMAATQRSISLGIATDACATLCRDYGAFEPDGLHSLWRKDSFTVQQLTETLLTEKEPTCQAFGKDTSYIGQRVDLAIWDDVYDPRHNLTAEARDGLKEMFSEVAEPRLEPGGVLVLQGQRFGADDIYAWALSQKKSVAVYESESSESEMSLIAPNKYHHICYKAHYEENCKNEHDFHTAKPYPDGCLLYPKRLPWYKLADIKETNPEKFEILYQQHDLDPADVLIDPMWIYGGVDPQTKEVYPGCTDHDRPIGTVPKKLIRPIISYAVADPSPTNYWSIQWYLYQPSTQTRFLIDHERKKMDINSFLDLNVRNGQYTGLMHEWQLRSMDTKVPITTWIFEANACQRWLLQHDFTKAWAVRHGVRIIPHQTTRNKHDEKYGIGSIKQIWRKGLVRLPMGQKKSTLACLKLIEELTHYPEWRTDDAVMAHWMGEYNLRYLLRDLEIIPPRKKIITWKKAYAA